MIDLSICSLKEKKRPLCKSGMLFDLYSLIHICFFYEKKLYLNFIIINYDSKYTSSKSIFLRI